jgi:hypothetical protein
MVREEEKRVLKERLLWGETSINVRELPETLKNEIFNLLKECEINENDEIIDWLYFDVFFLITTDGNLRYSLSIGDLEEKIKEIDKNFELGKFWKWIGEKDKRYWKFFKIMLLD